MPILTAMSRPMQKFHFTTGLAVAIAASFVLGLSTATAQAGCSKRVHVYSASWCGTCRRLRNYLDLSGISYTLLDADNPRVKADMRARFRSVAVPHMLVGRHAIRGLNTEKIRQYCR
ncbi:MAG: glutaredoxin family protein [Methyloceanibacter sp.]|nr:glutaredoxin family protein [Methyloceanibacter sp.]